jgi:hypothetical protein
VISGATTKRKKKKKHSVKIPISKGEKSPTIIIIIPINPKSKREK